LIHGSIRKLNELDIAQSSQKKKKKKKSFYALVGSSNENFIVLHHYVGKILKSHDYKLVHFTYQGTCVTFYCLISSDFGLVKIFKDLKLGLIYLSLLMIENHCLCDTLGDVISHEI
jgi:hypothetical protein